MSREESDGGLLPDVGGREILESVRDELEDMALRLAGGHVGTSGLTGAVVQMLGDAAAALTRALAETSDERGFFDALSRVDEALASVVDPLGERFGPSEATALEEARQWLKIGRARHVEEAAKRMPTPSIPPPRASGELRVSDRRPALLPWRDAAPYRELRRRPDPFAEDDEEEERRDDEERALRAAAEEGLEDSMTRVLDDDLSSLLGKAAPEAPGEAFLHAASRDLLEDVGVFGSLRLLGPAEPWAVAGRFEARLLGALDGLASLALPRVPSRRRLAIVERAWSYASEWLTPDRGRSFALALTMSSMEAPVVSRWLLRWLEIASGPGFTGAIDGICLGVSPWRAELIDAALSREARPEALVELLEGARRMRRASLDVVMLSAHDDPRVAEAAVRGLVHADREAAAAGLSAALAASSIAISTAAAEVLTCLGAAGGPATLRGRVKSASEGDRARAVQALCLLGAPVDGDLLLGVSLAQPELLPMLGWFGNPAHVPALLEALARAAASGGPGSASALDLGTAIHRITGLGRRADVRAVPPHEHRVDVERLTPLALAAAREADAPRLRFGRPWSPRVAAEELSDPRTPQGARRLLAVELGFARGRPLDFDVDDWTANQREGLDALTAELGLG